MIYELTIGGNTKRSTTGQHPVKVDFDKLPDASKEFVIRYGLKQYLADGMAGAANVEEAGNGVKARMAKLESGDLTRTRGEGKEAPDTVETRAIKLIKAAIRTQMKAKNVKADKDAINDAAKKVLADEKKGQPWRDKAKKQLDDEAKLAGDLDLSDMLADMAGAHEEEEGDED
jgi:hypothetical protein